jgi:hypothetical protein
MEGKVFLNFFDETTKNEWIKTNINMNFHDKNIMSKIKKGCIAIHYCKTSKTIFAISRFTGENRKHSLIDADVFNKENNKYNEYEFLIDYKKIFKGIHYNKFLEKFECSVDVHPRTSYQEIKCSSLYNTLKEYIERDELLTL